MWRRGIPAFAAMTFLLTLTGCAVHWKSVRERNLEIEVDKLQAEINRLQDERTQEVRRLTEEKSQATQQVARENQDLLDAQRRLAESLKQELGDARAKLSMTERGLVLTLLDEIFFDSGKAVVKEEGTQALKKVAAVLKETVPDSPVAVEGHTDNEPIKHSGWRSNWELSAARALAVAHHFIDSEGLEPARLRAVGFGEYQPVASNDTAGGRRQNRRVEVVILPKALKKAKTAEVAASD